MLLSSLIFFSSCDNSQEYIDERTDILNDNPFDEKVINNIDTFEKIRNLLIKNKEEFVGKKEKGIISISRNGKKKSLRLHRKRVDSLPNYLKEVELLVKKLRNEEILQGVQLHKDSSIMFVIQSTYISEYSSDLNKNLFKGKKFKLGIYKGINVGKDTVLNNEWIYKINVDRRYGH